MNILTERERERYSLDSLRKITKGGKLLFNNFPSSKLLPKGGSKYLITSLIEIGVKNA